MCERQSVCLPTRCFFCLTFFVLNGGLWVGAFVEYMLHVPFGSDQARPRGLPLLPQEQHAFPRQSNVPQIRNALRGGGQGYANPPHGVQFAERLSSKQRDSELYAVLLPSPAATYIRCLLSLNEVKEATSLLSTYLNNPVYKRTNVSGGNDLYSNAIVGGAERFFPSFSGFYEGKFYSRCIAMFHSVRPVAPTLSIASKHQLAAGKTEENGLVPLEEEKWKLIQNSLCYSAVIGSYYRLGEFQLALQYYDEARKLGVFPRFREGMMVADIHANSQEFRELFSDLKRKNVDVSGVPKNELFFI